MVMKTTTKAKNSAPAAKNHTMAGEEFAATEASAKSVCADCGRYWKLTVGGPCPVCAGDLVSLP